MKPDSIALWFAITQGSIYAAADKPVASLCWGALAVLILVVSVIRR